MGRSGGLASVAGITTGTVAYVLLATAGLSSLVLASTAAFDAVKYVGAAYLFVLGVRRLLGRGLQEPDEEAVPRTRRRAYAQGIVVNLTNPKTIVFVFAFLPQFVDPQAPHASLQILVLGLSFACLGFLSDSVWALAAGTVADRLRGSTAIARRAALGGRRRARRPWDPRGGVDAEPREVILRDLKAEDWPAVRAIYEDGIRGGDATFEAEPPSWERWDAAHPELRIVAERDAMVVGWAAVSPVSDRCCYEGVGEVSVYVAETARGSRIGRDAARRARQALGTSRLLDAERRGLPRERGVDPAPQGVRLPRGRGSQAARTPARRLARRRPAGTPFDARRRLAPAGVAELRQLLQRLILLGPALGVGDALQEGECFRGALQLGELRDENLDLGRVVMPAAGE